jgi:hypothetical protein
MHCLSIKGLGVLHPLIAWNMGKNPALYQVEVFQSNSGFWVKRKNWNSTLKQITVLTD